MKRAPAFWRPLGKGCARHLLVPVFAIAAATVAQPQTKLESVLAKMDQTSSTFRTAQADFTWMTFNDVINDFDDKQNGTIYFERDRNETRMAADISTPQKKEVLFSDGKIQIYQPSLRTVDIYDVGTHREEFESFLVLGFGSSGTELRKAFDVSYGADEKIDNIETARLDLTPKSDAVKKQFSQIVLWIDLQNGISVQQKLVKGDGYRIAKYSNIKLGEKIPGKVFKLNVPAKTTKTNH
jgi:outer membrane lipoprotein-sorting protein